MIDNQTQIAAMKGSSPDTRVLAAVSPALDRSVPIVVCIPAFRRPHHLRLTLDSLASQRTDRDYGARKRF